MRITNENLELMEERANRAIIDGPPGVYELASDVLVLAKALREVVSDALILTDRIDQLSLEL